MQFMRLERVGTGKKVASSGRSSVTGIAGFGEY